MKLFSFFYYFYRHVLSRQLLHRSHQQNSASHKAASPETHETHTGDGPDWYRYRTCLSLTLWSGADPQIQPLARLHMVFFFLNEPKWTKSRTGADCLHQSFSHRLSLGPIWEFLAGSAVEGGDETTADGR